MAGIRDFIDNTFEEYLSTNDWRTKENSNSLYSFGSLNKYIMGKSSALYWENIYNKVNPEIIKGHRGGDFHIHDMGSYSSYCFGASLRDLLTMGIQGLGNISTSAPAKRLRSATSQIANIATIFQNEIAGAVAFSSWNVYLAPFVYFDKLKRDNLEDNKIKIDLEYNEKDIEDIVQSIQNMIYALNSNSRLGSEPCFSNLTLDFNVLAPMRDQGAIHDGKIKWEYTYKEFQKEADLLLNIFAKEMLKGDFQGKPFSYPIPTFNVSKNTDWDKYDSVFELAAKTGIPYFGNFMHGTLKEDDVYSMCPLLGDTEILIKSNKGINIRNINEIYSTYMQYKSKYEVWTPNGWKNAIPNKMKLTQCYKVHLSDGSFVIMGEDHLQPIKNNITKKAQDLIIGDWVPYNKKIIEHNPIGSYELGYAIGAYAGDGSHDDNAITYSLCSFEKDDTTRQKLIQFWNNMGCSHTISDLGNNCSNLRINNAPYNIIKNFIDGTALNKTFSPRIFGMSKEFKQGILDGLLATDGSRDKKRFYTSSLQLRNDIKLLLISLGKKGLYHYIDTRDGRLGENPNYRIDYPNRDNYGTYYCEDEQYNYHSIIKIEKIEVNHTNSLYCFEVEDSSHLFMLANGMFTHNCRLRLSKKELLNKTGGLFGAGEKTGSVGVFTINLPALGYRNKGKDKTELFAELKYLMELGKEQLTIKRQVIKNEFDRGLYPALKIYLGRIDTLFSTIGFIGGHEFCLNYLGLGIETKAGRDFMIETIYFMRDVLSDFQETTGDLYNLEYTPAESTCYRLALRDVKRYGKKIIISGDKEPYYTNSVHLPVGIEWSLSDIFSHQNGLLSLATGGSVYHVYSAQTTTCEIIKKFLKTSFEKYDIPYLSFSPLLTLCPEHGLISSKDRLDFCPECNSKLNHYQRITGYIREVKAFNNGKAQEFEDRFQNSIQEIDYED